MATKYFNLRQNRVVGVLPGVLLLATPIHALADWARLGTSDNFVFYVDPDSLTNTDGITRLWVLNDFYQSRHGPSQERYQSSKVHHEFKCGEKMARETYVTRYNGTMGSAGALTSDAGAFQWAPLKPGTVRAVLFDFACQTAGNRP